MHASCLSPCACMLLILLLFVNVTARITTVTLDATLHHLQNEQTRLLPCGNPPEHYTINRVINLIPLPPTLLLILIHPLLPFLLILIPLPFACLLPRGYPPLFFAFFCDIIARITTFALEATLHQLRNDGYSVFVVRGKDMPPPASEPGDGARDCWYRVKDLLEANRGGDTSLQPLSSSSFLSGCFILSWGHN